MIRRLRGLPPLDVLAAMYPEPHDHRLYGRGHHERVEATIALAVDTIHPGDREVVADLSCGNAVIPRAIAARRRELHLGDLAGVRDLQPSEEGYLGPIEETVELLPGGVDVFVCSETLEHLDDPTYVLRRIRSRSQRLVLSTPLECWDDGNPEHLWAWDRDGVELLLDDWTVEAFTSVDSREYGEPYLYGIWVAA